MKETRRAYSFIVTLFAALILGIPLSLIWNFIPQFFPFAIAWVVVHPVYKIWRSLGEI